MLSNSLFFGIIIIFCFFPSNVLAGSCLTKQVKKPKESILLPVFKYSVNCTVLKTIDSCLAEPLVNPWKSSDYVDIYNYIATGHEVGDVFSVGIPEGDIDTKSGVWKNTYQGFHSNPKSNQTQAVVIKYWAEQFDYQTYDGLEEHHLEELMTHAMWSIASEEIVKENLIEKNIVWTALSIPKYFIWTQPLIAECPNLITGKPKIAFIEPKMDFQPKWCRDDYAKNKPWEKFNDAIHQKFAFIGQDQQCFDKHKFNDPFNHMFVMTDVSIEIANDRGERIQSYNHYNERHGPKKDKLKKFEKKV